MLTNELKINHISFDLWNTLIYPNPEYSLHRNQMLAELTDGGITVDEVKRRLVEAKSNIHQIELATGVGYTAVQAWSTYFSGEKDCLTENDAIIREVLGSVKDLAIEHPPLMPDSIKQMLFSLTANGIS